MQRFIFGAPVFFGFEPSALVPMIVLVVGIWGGLMGAIARRIGARWRPSALAARS